MGAVRSGFGRVSSQLMCLCVAAGPYFVERRAMRPTEWITDYVRVYSVGGKTPRTKFLCVALKHTKTPEGGTVERENLSRRINMGNRRQSY